ncbi:MAG: FHA domain-containing protein [Fimbriimonadaceae bacterium]
MKKAVLLILFSLLAALSLAQDLKTFTITPPGEGGFSYVLQKGDETKEPLPIEGKTVEVAAPEDPNGYTVFVIDAAINRAAKADLIQVLKSKKFEPKSDQFTLITSVEIRLKPEEGVIPAGTLTLTANGKSTTTLITASDNNTIRKSFLPDTNIAVELMYESEGKKFTSNGMLTPTIEAGPAILTLEVPAKFAVNAGDGGPKTDKEKSDEKPKDTGQNPFISFLRLIVGLAVVGGLGYGAYYYYKNNQKLVENMANQAGLVPNQNPDPTGALPPEPVKKDLQKIDLGSSATALGATGATSVPITTHVKNPRLVTASGDIHLLPEGSQTIGREAADLTLTGESSVSRLHATIARSGDQITVADSGSTNGTYVNGTKITSPTVLNPGDTIQFGAIAYRYEE